MVYHALYGRTREKQTTSDHSNQFDATAILGGASRKISSDNFKRGQVTAILGGCELDLRDATIIDSPAEIYVSTFMGGVEMRVPQEWEVQVKGTAILGGFEDNTSQEPLNPGGQALKGDIQFHYSTRLH